MSLNNAETCSNAVHFTLILEQMKSICLNQRLLLAAYNAVNRAGIAKSNLQLNHTEKSE